MGRAGAGWRWRQRREGRRGLAPAVSERPQFDWLSGEGAVGRGKVRARRAAPRVLPSLTCHRRAPAAAPPGGTLRRWPRLEAGTHARLSSNATKPMPTEAQGFLSTGAAWLAYFANTILGILKMQQVALSSVSNTLLVISACRKHVGGFKRIRSP